MYKINSELKKSFERLAKNLPKTPLIKDGEKIMEKRVMFGDHLISKGITKTTSGIKINPKKKYVANVPVIVDHFQAICKAYELNGKKGVERYVKPFLSAEDFKRYLLLTNNVEVFPPEPTSNL